MDKKKNEGISCSVSNCIYHEGTNGCVAEKVAVGRCSSCGTAETVCETFRTNNR